MAFPGDSVVKNPPANARDIGLIPGSGRSPGGGHDNLLLYSCLGNPTDRGTWQATVHGVAKRQTRLSKWACKHTQWLKHCIQNSTLVILPWNKQFFCFQHRATIEAVLRDKEGKAALRILSTCSLTTTCIQERLDCPATGPHSAKDPWIWNSCERTGHAWSQTVHLGLPDLANKNTEWPAKLSLINNE